MADRRLAVFFVIKGLWWEDGVRLTKKLNADLNKTLKAFSKFNECEDYVFEDKKVDI